MKMVFNPAIMSVQHVYNKVYLPFTNIKVPSTNVEVPSTNKMVSTILSTHWLLLPGRPHQVLLVLDNAP